MFYLPHTSRMQVALTYDMSVVPKYHLVELKHHLSLSEENV